MNEEFYIGYLDRAPRGIARHTRATLAFLAFLTGALVLSTAVLQTPAAPGRFDYGVRTRFEGILHETPLPILRHVAANGSVTNYLLVGEGKHGLPAFARGHDGHHVQLEGSLIQSLNGAMIEVNAPESFRDLGSPRTFGPAPDQLDLGEVTLTGELVDTKCHLGVMRPDTGKIHRACAVRCLSGGVPPGLLLRRADGFQTLVLLTGPRGGPLAFNPQWAARRLRAHGTLTLSDHQAILAATRLELAD